MRPLTANSGQNRDLTMPIFRGDEEAALDQIERKLAIERSAA
jgi:hypothetical protein